eukprot:g42089.t1
MDVEKYVYRAEDRDNQLQTVAFFKFGEPIMAQQSKTARQCVRDAMMKQLSETRVVDLLKRKKSKHDEIITLSHSERVSDAMDILSENNILSAPVLLSASIEDHESGNYLGMASVQSILYYLVRDQPENLSEFWDRRLITVVDKDDIGVILSFEEENPIADLVRTAFFSSHDAVHRDTEPRTYVHRVAIFKEDGSISGIVSQTDVIRHIYHSLASKRSLISFWETTVNELGMGLTAPKTVHETDRTWDSFRVLSQSGLSGLGVVDEEGRLVANLSASDLRSLKASEVERLKLPLKEFLKPEAKSVVSIETSASLLECMKKLVYDKVHRVYVVDKKGAPTGVITLTDLLHLIFDSTDSEVPSQPSEEAMPSKRRLSADKAPVSFKKPDLVTHNHKKQKLLA